MTITIIEGHCDYSATSLSTPRRRLVLLPAKVGWDLCGWRTSLGQTNKSSIFMTFSPSSVVVCFFGYFGGEKRTRARKKRNTVGIVSVQCMYFKSNDSGKNFLPCSTAKQFSIRALLKRRGRLVS